MGGFGAALGAAASAAPAAGAAAAAGSTDYRAQVLEIYKAYNQSKLGEVDTILKKYA